MTGSRQSDATGTRGPDPAPPLVRIRNLAKAYRRGGQVVPVLSDIALDIRPGDFTALMGPSGSGKSTLLNLIAGIDKPDAGELRVDGIDITALSESALADWRAANIGFIFQFYNLMPVLTAWENVELPLMLTALSRSERRERVELTLAAMGLADRMQHYPNELSGGQQQRVAIARALVTNPVLLLADEPTGNLDSRTSIEVMDIFQRLNVEHGLTIVLVTHEHDIAEYGTRIISFIDGRVRVDRPVETRRTATVELAGLVADGDDAVSA